jgi:hypothetical protein
MDIMSSVGLAFFSQSTVEHTTTSGEPRCVNCSFSVNLHLQRGLEEGGTKLTFHTVYLLEPTYECKGNISYMSIMVVLSFCQAL